MKRYLFLLALFAICNSSPLNSANDIRSYTNEREKDHYTFSYTLSDDQSRYEEGILNENGVYSVTGFYKYRGTNGKLYIVDYMANEKIGYRATVKIYDDLPLIAPVIDPSLLKTLVG
ncbi:hypothetical protein PVAND_009502 [Polypedilum vanderplanki]|uniref:Uncharacterized protein n=1 Tax=Polypedilum vanderplanki TaxID=319348 RepID=A0A9J6CDC9_POLVA|nr:hypothetical protein PVAND_009502 [Polypedilum vanderplanki]